MKPLIHFLALLIFLSSSCNNKELAKLPQNEAELLHAGMYHLTAVIVHDIFSPPVASRIYAYSSLAFYEGIRLKRTNEASIAERLNGFPAMPLPNKDTEYNYMVVALRAFYKVGSQLIFSKDSLRLNEEAALAIYQQSIDENVYAQSKALGDSIAAQIMKRAATDNYKQTRGMPRYNVYKENGKWTQTPPDYMDAVEPHWAKIQPLLLDSAAQFKPIPPPPFNTDSTSEYYRQLMEVYNTTTKLTDTQDTIARYWDDNAFVTQHEGHMMYANKKTTPGGHWMGITSILAKQKDLDVVDAARAYTMVAASILDGFITCWDEKYRSRTIRPITVIHDLIDADWNPVLQTPPFPEYPSGHSTISMAAATVLIHLFDDNTPFTDTTELEYLGLKRHFPSISKAAEEVGISRLYGGIHYRAAIEQGSWQGQQVGQLYINEIKK